MDGGIKICKAFLKALRLTWRHGWRAWRRRRRSVGIEHPSYFEEMRQGSVTLRYPYERLPLPEVARHQLYLYEEDCIGCDKCARICPVQCITIEKEKAPTLLGRTSDGSPKRFYIHRFDIDMAQCCYCGLCTIVCPTECLVMLPQYEYATYDRKNLVFSFAKSQKTP